MIAINGTAAESSAEFIKEYVNEKGYSFTVLLDKNGGVFQKYLVRYVPTNYVIDSEGRVVETIPGGIEKTHLKEIMDQVR